MKIAHWAPFAPNRCGLYEAARDFVRADALRDHEVLFVDTGVSTSSGREAPVVGGMDPRGGWLLETSPWQDALDADLWVCHDGVQDSISARCQVPMVWVLHGRPLACFRPEQAGSLSRPFTIVPELASWPRVKALVTMWDEFVPAWSMVAGDKLRCTGEPPVDRARFQARGPRYVFKDPGQVNLLICDSWRDDVDVYEVAVACYQAARMNPSLGIKVHFWAVETGPGKQLPWQPVWAALSKIGALGEIHGREKEICDVYRAADVVVSPHVIGVRTILEALSCGTPVVAATGCRYTPYTASPGDADGFARQIARCAVNKLEGWEPSADICGELCDLPAFGERMETIYSEALARELVSQ